MPTMSNRSLLLCVLVSALACKASAHSTSFFTRPYGTSGQEVYLCHWHGDLSGPEVAGTVTLSREIPGQDPVTVSRFPDQHENNIDLTSWKTDPSYYWSDWYACPDRVDNDCVRYNFTNLVAYETYTLLSGDTVYLTEGCDDVFPQSFTFVPAYVFYAGVENPPVPIGDGDVCDVNDAKLCSVFAACNKTGTSVTCTCPATGFVDVYNNGSVCEDVNECAQIAECHSEAECINTDGSFSCVCADGYVGDGYECSGDAWGVRSVFEIPEVSARRALTSNEEQQLKHEYAMLILGDPALPDNASIVEGMPTSYGHFHYGDSMREVDVAEAEGKYTLLALFKDKTAAEAVVTFLGTQDMSTYWYLLGAAREVIDGPELYRWSLDPNQINPTGLTVDRVYFEPSCLGSGCWKVDVTYTVGTDNFNVFYLPKTNGDDELSYDQSYDAVAAPWLISPEDTFLPRNHPCTSADYLASTDPTATPASVTACCFNEFFDLYRPVSTFPQAVSSGLSNALANVCGHGARNRDVTRSSIPIIAKRGQTISGNVFERPIAPAVQSISGELFEAEKNGIFAQGVFAGMTLSRIDSTGTVDEYVGIYKATLTLDEVELRTLAGMLRGTVGVEHTVDTFVGLAEFSPTGQFVLDPFVTQVNIHLEKTSFFSVSTHGTNDLTFLEYVNMRLVTIYDQDADFSDASNGMNNNGGSTLDFIDTSSTASADYVQVTFTLGSQYEVNANSDLIPSSSVRAGKGTFFADAESSGEITHKCDDFTGQLAATFATRMTQACSPASVMCTSPISIPDSFVVYNIPLGIDYLPAASSDLANNIFVDMVVSVIVKPEARTGNGFEDAPNEGGNPYQMKTTLTASIPVVDGGVNIFCDGLVSKTDLKDVANADIVVGSASSSEEFSRLRIKKDIASTQLASQSTTEINSDSIEAGLMTLILKGNSSYFQTNAGRRDVSLELEDVITIHIMQDDGQGELADKVGIVAGMLAVSPDDNSFADGLDTNGYALNEAFYFTIDRDSQRAHLEPSQTLLDECPFNPTRPTGNTEIETCITRRDVRYRNYPARTGSFSTAMEICANVDGTTGQGGRGALGVNCPAQGTRTSDESKFFTTIFGNSDYAKDLAVDYANVIATEYGLNARYRRAYWINPGYEWTPTQTGGNSIFSLSQFVYLFALISMDEGISSELGNSIAGGPGPSFRRRMLLQADSDGLKDAQASAAGEKLSFAVTPTSMMATAFGVPADRVATFAVQLQLTEAEACMESALLQDALRETLDDFVQQGISPYHTLQVTKLKVNKGDIACSRRSLARKLLALSSATADVTMLVVFKEGAESQINVARLAEAPGVLSIAPLAVSPKVNTDAAAHTVIKTPAPEASGSSSSSVGLIAGICGGVAGFVIVAGGALLYMRSKSNTPEVFSVVQTINVSDLKAQLSEEA